MGERKPAIDTGLVKDLADILTETNLTEIEIEQGELRIRVSRENHAPTYVQSGAPTHQPALPAAAPHVQPATAHQSQKTDEGEKRSGDEVPSPMVGTVYLAAAPGAAPFIEVGQSVKEGQTLLIIEAMKTMNQIPAPRAGTVKEILIADSEPVEYGQPLVVLG